jgi:Recombination endonuclease VII/HNH endonuclease
MLETHASCVIIRLPVAAKESDMRKRGDKITQDRLKELVNYDPETGVFTRRVAVHGYAVGSVMGTYFERDNSMLLQLDGRQYPMANLAWLYMYGEWPEKQLLKLDGDGRNLVISNLAIPLTGKRGEITQERLKAIMDYDANTGAFVWKIRPAKNIPIGSRVGKNTKANGYLYCSVDGVDYTMQRLAWLYVYGEFPKTQLRFKDGNQLNVAIGNLFESLSEFASRAEQDKHWRQRNPEKIRGITLKRDFGISIGTYEQMLDVQGGVCACCKKPETQMRNGKLKWLAVDHCHDVLIVRGLLCSSCNMAIGLMGDDPDRLRAAADYLERSRALSPDDPSVIKLMPTSLRASAKKEAA